MAARHQKFAPIEEYGYVHLTALQASKINALPTAQAAGVTAVDLGHGVVLARVAINDPGSGITLSLFNGASGPLIAAIKPTAHGVLDFGVLCDAGIYYTLAGTTAGSYTLVVSPLAV
jgi:hypothetical protein